MNLLVGGITELLAESIVLAERAGLRKEVLRETLLGSVLGSPFMGYKAPQLLERQFAPLFSAKLLLKDLDLILHLARDIGAPLPVTKVIRDLYGRAVAAGHGDQDIAAVIEQLSAEPAITGS
jgi:3-hydroxyisobutyrate dehydrogenase-like beta-hydroxyacid dehydrogenase